jgi:hypothetical protein
MTDQLMGSKKGTAAASPRRYEPVRLAGPGVTMIGGGELRRAVREMPRSTLRPGHVPAGIRVAREATVTAQLQHGQVSAADMMTYPFSSIGRIMAKPKSGGSFQGVCTGVLVGPDMVLTATHLLRDRPLGEFTFQFIPGYHDGARTSAPDGHSRTSSLFTGEIVNGNPTGSVHGDHVAEIVNGFDFSIFRLVHRLGDHWGHLGTITHNGSSFYEARAWKSVGYPVVLNGGRFPIQSPIKVADVETDDYGSREIETESLIGGSILGPGVNWDGWSGGPLLTFYNGGWWVGGVMSGWDLDGPLDFDGVHVFAGGPRLGVVMDLAYRQFGHISDWPQWVTQPEDMNASFGYSRPKAGTSVAACSWGPGRLDLFWRSDDDHLRHAWYPYDGGWSWEQDMTASFGLTPLASNPAVTSDVNGQMDVFWRSADGHLRHIWFPHTSGDWSWEQDMTASFGLTPSASAPAACSWEPGRFDLFWRSADGHLRHVWYPYDGDWSWEQDMTASFGLTPSASAPAACSWEPGHMDLFWRSADGHLRHIWFPHTSGDWSWEQDMTAGFGHGAASGDPTACSWAPGRLDLFWRGGNNHLGHAWYPYGEDWSGTEDMTNAFTWPQLASSPTACSWEAGRLDVFWVGGDGAIKHVWQH